MDRPCFVICPRCGGEGEISGHTYFPDYRCDLCDGTGAVEEEVQLVTEADLDEIDAEEQRTSALLD